MTDTASNSPASDGATTGSAIAPLRKRTKLADLPPIIKEEQLTARHRLVIDYMVNGTDKPLLAQRIKRARPIVDDETGQQVGSTLEPVPLGEPLTLMEAAELVGIRKRTARVFARQPAFQRLLGRETQAFREGAKARAWRNIDAIANDPGLGKAADRKVQLAANQALIGEQSERSGVTVNVGIQTVTPGYVLDLTPQKPADSAKTIDAEPNE